MQTRPDAAGKRDEDGGGGKLRGGLTSWGLVPIFHISAGAAGLPAEAYAGSGDAGGSPDPSLYCRPVIAFPCPFFSGR